ncbi:unnamed protein product [Gongylonema pulchrum]|uniref:PH domain-containing protein n=1 Tax=Gongylonema pulchrum TaxID=637853 RepID=A0A183D941_9BILA|nr:unnamed protein product [Gongylonema pulchrum]
MCIIYVACTLYVLQIACLQFDGRLKQCVEVMTPDETILLRAEDDAPNDDWYEALMSAAIPARVLRLGRPVLETEFFECAWDVNLVDRPKLRKAIANLERRENICKKNPALAGAHRLCFYPHTIILCRRGIEPAKLSDLPPSGIPPFKPSDFIDIPVSSVIIIYGTVKTAIIRGLAHLATALADATSPGGLASGALEIHFIS